MKYIILMANNPNSLSQVVNDFRELNPSCLLVGGPYCDNLGHYQAIDLKIEKQLLTD